MVRNTNIGQHGVHHSDELSFHYSVFMNPHEYREYIGELTSSDFKGYDPLNDSPSLDWIGRKDLKGKGLKKRKQVMDTFGDYIKEDHDQIKKSQGHSKMTDLVDSIDLESLKRVLRWNDNRGRVSAGRLLRGESRFRRQPSKRMVPVEAVALVVPTGANAGTSPEVLFAKTAVALACAQLLEEVGYPVEVWGYAYSENCLSQKKDGTKNTLSAFRMKEADQPMNLAVSASLGSAWMFRTGTFGVWASQGEADWGLGRSRSLSQKEGREIAKAIGLKECHLLRKGGNYDSLDTAISDAIEDCIEALTKWTGGN